jgi:hypothetical protein
MYPSTNRSSRYLRKAHKAYLARIVAGGALVLLPTACGRSDADVFDAASQTTVAETSTVSATAGESTTTESTVEATDSVATTETTTEAAESTPADTTEASAAIDSAATASGTSVAASTELVVDFTFGGTSSAPMHNPYVAVWVEDADGNLVKTVSLWFESGKGTRWLNELRSWYSASGGAATSTSSGATRAAGTYSVVWDGTDEGGNLVPQGDYVLYVEAAREHGPYEITSTPITLNGSDFTATLDDNGELSAISATLTA